MNTNKYKEKNTKVGLESNSRNIFLVGKRKYSTIYKYFNTSGKVQLIKTV